MVERQTREEPDGDYLQYASESQCRLILYLPAQTRLEWNREFESLYAAYCKSENGDKTPNLAGGTWEHDERLPPGVVQDPIHVHPVVVNHASRTITPVKRILCPRWSLRQMSVQGSQPPSYQPLAVGPVSSRFRASSPLEFENLIRQSRSNVCI